MEASADGRDLPAIDAELAAAGLRRGDPQPRVGDHVAYEVRSMAD